MRTAMLLVLAALAARGEQGTGNREQGAMQDCRVDTAAVWYRRQRAWLSEAKHDWTNDSLRAVLLKATGVDASALELQIGVHVAGKDAPPALTPDLSAAIAQLKRAARGAPGPTRSAVGPAGARAFYMMALADSTFTNSAMHRMMEAGPEESFAPDVAALEDVTRLGAGRKQIYGTQFRVDDRGTVVLAPMEDSAHADLRRENAGFPPFAVSLCLARARR
jgi:hypothetical protein